jgi:hypothetical protein
MDRPLWVIFLSTIVLAFALMRIGTGIVLLTRDADTAMIVSHAVQALVAGGAALAIWITSGKRT